MKHEIKIQVRKGVVERCVIKEKSVPLIKKIANGLFGKKNRLMLLVQEEKVRRMTTKKHSDEDDKSD